MTNNLATIKNLAMIVGAVGAIAAGATAHAAASSGYGSVRTVPEAAVQSVQYVPVPVPVYRRHWHPYGRGYWGGGRRYGEGYGYGYYHHPHYFHGRPYWRR